MDKLPEQFLGIEIFYYKYLDECKMSSDEKADVENLFDIDSNGGTREFDSLGGVDVLGEVVELRFWGDDIFVEGGD